MERAQNLISASIFAMAVSACSGLPTSTNPDDQKFLDELREKSLAKYSVRTTRISESRKGWERYFELENELSRMEFEKEKLEKAVAGAKGDRKLNLGEMITRIQEGTRSLQALEPKIESVRSEMAALETATFVNFILEHEGRIVGLRDTLARAKTDACTWELGPDGDVYYFKTLDAQDKWMSFIIDPKKRVEYHARGNPEIQRCLESKEILDGVEKLVVREMHQACNYYGPITSTKWSPTRYRVKRLDGRIQVSTNFYLDYRSSNAANRELSFQRIHEAKDCVKKFYASHGLDLNVEFYDSSKPIDPQRVGFRINLYDYYERTNSINWSALGENGYVFSPGFLCTMIAHEIGHTIGLPDRYNDPKCGVPGPVLKDWNLMGPTYREMESEQYHLDPQDIHAIIAPLCGEK